MENPDYRCHGCGKQNPTYILDETSEVNVDGFAVEIEERWVCQDCGYEEVITRSE